jgi:Terminase large subunit, T4likevirus-type, N-terminal/Terminase RNaseH-like domain
VIAAVDRLLARRLVPERRRWCPHEPHPTQARFLELDDRDVLFGGAAGGGKSDALLLAALQYAHVPGYAALILRRTYADLALPNAIMDRAQQWIPREFWNDGLKRFKLPCPSGGHSTLTFGYLDSPRDKYRYQGAELQFVGADELTQFPEEWIRYLFSRLRKPQIGALSAVPLRFRGATNPGGIGHEWVRRRYVDAKLATGQFVPSKLDDNPTIDGAAYRATLAELDEVTRRQLEDGIWLQDSSGLVYKFDPTRNLADDMQTTRKWMFVAGIDYGFRDSLSIVVLGWPPGSKTTYVVHVEKHTELDPTAGAEAAKRLIDHYKPHRVVGDVGGLGKGYAEEARRRWHLPIEPAQKNDKLGYIKLLNGALQRSELQLLPGCEELATEWAELPWSDKDHTKEADGFDNHAADATLYAWRESYSFAERLPSPSPTPAEAYEAAEQLAIEKLAQAGQRSQRRR